MKLTIISDTHGQQKELGQMEGDVLIHCGDMFNLYARHDYELEQMDNWFAQQHFDLILCIGGNHDFSLEEELKREAQPFISATFLNGESYTHQGVKFFGAPWVPDLYGQAFFVEDEDLEEKWSIIPNDTDVLITHTPPAGILDESSQNLELGCRHLAKKVSKVKPKLHCFGHIHASSGIAKNDESTFINAALAGRGHQLVRGPYSFDLL